ncbi:DNA repair protein RecO [Micrococcales bacterium 31B]|nr:DNA repair protein RecO [Micrococcales bacterium 31B]
MRLFRDEAVVLRTQKLGEADRIITLLTREGGIHRAVGKGVRKTSSRMGARLEPFNYVDVQFYEGRSLDTVTQCEIMGAYGGRIAVDYAKFSAGSAMLETAERLADQTSSTQQFWLLAGALRALAEGAYPPPLVLDSYLLRALSIAGWAPSFADCAKCGEAGPHKALNVSLGGSVCSTCRVPGSVAPRFETLELLGALIVGAWPIAVASTDEARREASGIIAAYVQWHIEKNVRSLALVER